MSPASLTVKQKIANGFVIFTAIWSSAIMPVIPSYAKMLDNNDLPTLGSDNIIAEDNTERLVAEYSKTLGTFLSQKKKSKDLSDMAQNYARNKATNEATKEIESWLSKSGNAKLSINLDKKLSVKNSQLDWLIPWYDQPDTLLFTQHSVHRNDGRLQTNNGIGLRRFYEKNTLGINAFIDHDLSHYHTRAGVGVEYWQDYLKVNANTYFALSSWKSTSELNHDFNAKPANGWDIQAEGWLPAYPHLGGSLKYEQYYGDSVALFEKTKRQKNPKAATIGAQWTPFPLLTLNANHKIGSQGKKETQAKIQFTWTLGKSLAHHLDPTKVAEARRLSGNRYDFIERNNNIILDYQKKTLLHLSLPAKIQGETGQAIPLVKSFSSKYPLKQIVWQAPELLLAGGSISSTDQTATVILPTYKTANTAETTQKINRYRLQGTAFDTKGNASPVAETLIEITNVGIISISPNDIKSQGKGLANGHDVNSINVVVRDSHGNVVPNAKVVFILPNALTLATKKINTGTVIQSEFQRELRKKMHAMKVDKPREYTATTNSKGEAQVQFTSQVAGTYEVSAYTNNHPPVKAQVVFKSDIKQAYVRSLTVQKTGAVADGISKNLAKIYVTDTNGNLISGQHVKLTATNAKLVAPELTNEQGEIDLVLTSLKTGLSEITATINGKSETTSVYFINDKLTGISITNISKALAGEEGTITLKLTDKQGNPVSGADGTINAHINQIKTPITIWEINANSGEYEGSLPGQKQGEYKVQADIDGILSSESLFTVLAPSNTKPLNPDGSGLKGQLGVIDKVEINIKPTNNFKSGDEPLITVTLTDAFDNELDGIDFNKISLGNRSGDTLGWYADGHGDYSTYFPLTTLGTIDITASINGIFSPTTEITVGKATGNNSVQNIVVTPNTTNLNAGDKPTIKVELTDKNGHQVKDIKEIEVTIGNDKHTLPVTPNTDGSYTAELPAQQSGDKLINVSVNGKDSNKETLNVQQPAPVSPNNQGQKDQKGVVKTLEIKTGSISNLKSGDTLDVTVTVTDAFGNGIKGLDKNNLHLGNLKGDTLNWVDNNDGSYTAQVPLKDLGNIDLTASINGLSSQKTDITVGKATGDNSVQNIVVTPNTTNLNAGDKPTIKVELTDKNGHQVKDIKEIEVTIGNDKHTLPVTPNTDGSYTAELPAQQSGDKLINVSVNGKDSNKETLNVQQPAPVSPNNQGQKDQKGVVKTLEIKTGSISNLKSGDTLDVTVTVTDAFGNGIKGLDKNNLHLGNLKGDTLNWVDNNDGSYTAQVPLKDLGNIDVTASINGLSSQKTDITVGKATGDNSVQNIVVTPNTTNLNAGDKPTIKVELTDKNGHQVKDIKEIEVTIGNDKHTLPVTPNTDGSYTAELPAQQSGDKLINVSVNGKDSNKETLNVQQPAPVSPNNQGQTGQQGVVDKLDIKTGSISNLKSGDTLDVTVTVTDAFGNGIKGLDKNNLHLGNLKGDTLNWVDNNDGSYTAQVPLKDLGNIDLTASINGISSQKTDITVSNATGDNNVQNIVVTPNTKTPNAGDKPTIKVELTDKNGHQVKDIKGIEVTIGNDKHTLPVTPNTDGSYTAELPALQAGDHQITATVNGQSSTQDTLEVKKPAPIGSNSSSGTGKHGERGVINNISMKTSDATHLQSGNTLDITVTIIDAFNNPLTAIDPSNIILDGYKASSLKWLDNGDGTYTAPLLLTQIGTNELVTSINGHKSPLLTITVGNTTDINKVANVELEPITPSEAGESQTITVKVTDKYQHPVTAINNVIAVNIDGQSASIILAESRTQEGTYTGTLPAQNAGNYTVKVTANNKTVSKPWTVKTAATITVKEKDGSGAENQRGVVKTVTLASSPINDLKSGQSLQLTVTLKDAFSNTLEGISGTSLQLKHQQPSVSSTIWVDLRNGDYTTILPLTKIGQDTLTVKVNQITTLPLNINVGNATSTTHIHKVDIKNIEKPAAGETSAITLVLTDANNQPITGINNNAVVSINGAEELLKITETVNKGTYRGTLSGQKSGDHKVIVTVGGVKSTESTLTVSAPVPITINYGGKSGSRGVTSRVALTVSPIKDLKSGDTLMLTAILEDAFGNPLTGVDLTQSLTHKQTGKVTWTAQKDGTYTANLVLTQLGLDHVFITVNQRQSPTIIIDVKSQLGINAIHKIDISDITNATAGAQSTFTVALTDAQGNPVNGIQNLDVTLDKQKLPNIVVTQQADGRYSGKLPGQQSGSYDVVISANKQSSVAKTLTVAQPDTVTANSGGTAGQRGVVSDVELKTATASLVSGDNVLLTVTLKDSFNNPLKGVDSANIVLQHNQQAATVTWIDQNNGSYTTTLPLNTLGSDALKATVNRNESLPINIDVASPHHVTQVHRLTLEPISSSSTGSAQTITVKVADTNSHGVTQIADDIKVTLNGKPLNLTLVESKTDKGTYTTTLPAQKAGNYSVKVTVNKQEAKETWVVNTATPLKATNTDGSGIQGNAGVVSSVELATTASSFKSGESVKLTLTLKDAFDNTLSGIDVKNITLTHKQTGHVTWVDNKDGTYTADLPLTTLGTDRLVATVNLIKSTSVDLNVEKAIGNSQIHQVDIVDITKPQAGEEAAFTVSLTDTNSHAVMGITEVTVNIAKQQPLTIAVTQQADGRYSGKLPGQQSGSYDVVISANKQSSVAKTLTVAQPDTVTANGGGTAGQRGVVSDVELKTATASLVSGDNVLLTVTLKDSFNNPLKGVDSNNITLMHKQTGNATWTDHNNGQYTTTLPIKVLGSDALTATVNTINSSAVNITVGNTADIKQASKLTLEPISSSSTGSAQTITVKVADTNSHGVTQIADDIKVTLNGKPLNLTLVESKTDKGTYTTTLPAQKAGNYSVKVTVNKQEAKETWVVNTATPLKATNTDGSGIQGNAGVVSSVELATTASSFKSGESVKLTLTLKDAFDNALNGIEVKNITLTHKQTGHVTWVDNKDGTYSANVDLKILGKDALTATVNKINSQVIDFEVIKTDGISKVKNVKILNLPTAIAGMDSTLVVALTDLNNHAVTGITEVTVKIDKTQSSKITVAPLDNGHYILTLPAKQSGSYDIVVTANNINSASKTWIVSNPSTIVAENSDGSGTQGQRGVVANVQFSTAQSSNLQAGSHLALTVMLKDSFNNPLRGIDSNSIAITHQQSGSVTWKDNGNGTYTADVLLSQLGPDILKVTVNRISQSQTIDVKAPQGKSAVHKVELNAANKTWTVGDSVELQLTLADSHGNGVEKVQTSDIQLEHNHVLATKLTWLEKGAGIYTTTIPLHKQGKNTFVSQVNNKASTALAVNVSALTDPAQVKAVELKASTNQLTVGSQTELTLTLTDQWNNGVEGITDKDITINDAHIKKNLTGLSWVSKGNGSYTASTVVSIAGIHSLRATVNQVQSHNVLINALPSTSQSYINKVQLTANLSTITAGSKVTLSLKVTDMDNNPVIRLNNNTITLTDGNHKVSAVWDEDSHGLGLYTTNIMLSDVKTHNLMASIGQFTDTTDVTVNSPVGKDAVKTITISPIANSDAGQPSSLSIGLTDQYKNPVKNVSSSDITVTINRQKQRIIFMEKNVLNKYIAQLPASKTGRYQIMVEANGQSETVHWDVNSPKEIPITSYDKDGLRGSLETISITHSAKTHAVNSGDNITLTVGLKDKFDNTLTGAASSLKLLTNLHSASAWKELSGGLYTQELTMNKLRKQPIQVVADKVLSDKLELNVAPAKGANHVYKTTLETNEGTIEAGKDMLLTLTLTDNVNNSVIDVDTNAIQLTNNGKLTAVTWANPQDGVYTSKLPLDIVGNYQFKATVNNQPSRIETIEVTAPSGQAKVAKAQLASNIASLDAGKNLELTLTLKDQHDNFVIGVNGADITLKDSHTTEVIDNNRVAWRMVSEGIYNASIPLTLIGNHMLTVTVNHQSASTSRITVNSLKGTGNVNQITLTAAQNMMSAGEKTTLTLNVLDSFGNAVSDVLPSDINLTNADAQITTLASWTKVPSTIGTYNASVQLDKVMAHTLIAKVNGQTKTTQIQVNPMKGVKNVAAVSLQAPSTFEVDEKNKLTLTLTDKFGNGVVEVNPSDISLILGSTKHVVTWVEDKNGVYHTELALNKVGNQSISGEVNHISDTKTIHVNSPTGKDKVASIRFAPSTASVLPGKSVTLNLALEDQYGNGVKNIRSADISLSDSHSAESFTSLSWVENSTQTGFYSATVSLKKTTEHTLTVSVNNVSQATKITVQPFTDVKQVNSVELLLDQKQISLGGKVNFTVTTKDIYGNDVTIKATDIQLQNANGTIHQPTWQLQGVQHKGELTLSTSGSYVITAKVGAQTSAPTNLIVQTGKPVFAPGKSEFSANKYDIDEGSNANITIKLELKDASGTPISGKKPHISASAGTIVATMKETTNGVYTSTFNNSVAGKSEITIDNHSIDYSGVVSPITVVTYGKSNIKTTDQPRIFSIDDGFPNTGFAGASFQITVPIGQQTDYDWSVDEDWLSINDKGVVTMLRKPTPIGGRNAMKPIFKGVPKAHTGYKRTVDYQFTLKKWYTSEAKTPMYGARQLCSSPYRMASKADISDGTQSRFTSNQYVYNEWGSNALLSKLKAAKIWTSDIQEEHANSYFIPLRNKFDTDSNQKSHLELNIATALCVEDLN